MNKLLSYDKQSILEKMSQKPIGNISNPSLEKLQCA